MRTSLDETTQREVLDNDEVAVKKNDIDNRLISIVPVRGQITSASLTYTKTGDKETSRMYDDQWSFRSFELFSGDTQTTVNRFCPPKPNTFISANSQVVFGPC
jgi:hypothetical protein